MTLIISITTQKGIVLASDSRKTRTNEQQIQRLGSDNVSKLQQINRRVVVGKAGLTSFTDSTGKMHNVTDYITEFIRSTPDLDNKSVKDISQELYSYLYNNFPWKEYQDKQIAEVEKQFNKRGGKLKNYNQNYNVIEFEVEYPGRNVERGNMTIELITLLVNGYNPDGTPETYQVIVPGNIDIKRKKDSYGSTWIGQGDVVSRLILGYDQRMFNIEMLHRCLDNNPQDQVRQQLSGLEYNFAWSDLELQDAIELAVELIKITSITYKYADGVRMDLGVVQGVGGPIDIAVITQNYVEWVSRKKLHYPED